jgi:hypothetical protein
LSIALQNLGSHAPKEDPKPKKKKKDKSGRKQTKSLWNDILTCLEESCPTHCAVDDQQNRVRHDNLHYLRDSLSPQENIESKSPRGLVNWAYKKAPCIGLRSL